MKGLLVKDFKLMKVQKNFFLVIIAAAVGMTMFSDDVSFTLGLLTFAVSLFTLSTISYDEFDNGNAFLFSLPITRSNYVIEKYCLGLILGCGSWLLSTFMAMVASILKGIAPALDIIMIALIILPLMLIIQAVMLPFQLKFGEEKGRIAIIGAIGLVSVISIVIVKIAEVMNIDIVAIINNLSTLSMTMVVTAIIVVAIVLLLVSLTISVSIMSKKEF